MSSDVSAPSAPLLSVRGLEKRYHTGHSLFGGERPPIRALDGVDLDLGTGETLAIVGESGSGKSTLARLLVGLEQPSAGTARFRGRDVFTASATAGRDIQIVFQDPYTSLNPRMTLREIIGEAWEIHPDLLPRDKREARIRELLEQVGLGALYADRYPHALSGGQRQRVGIARALAVSPPLIICDEPVSALDVSVQAQVINLLRRLQRELGLSYLFISHDMVIVRSIASRIAVMYLGRIVETGTEDDIYERATHPYTQSLLSSVPVADPKARNLRNRIALKGEIPSPSNIPSGCRFRTRCWKARDVCAQQDPALADRGNHGHASACLFPELPTASPASSTPQNLRR
ncbi:MAG TPA: oligopeptide/dipeptide ABC transporter ATP-binding protein [Devosiaceae bacterium]|jgi:oligopeptide transport system ATP-binding protein